MDGLRRISYAGMAAAFVLAMIASPAAGAKKGPDLTVSALRVSGSPAAGQPFGAKITVKNAGKAKAKASQTAVVLSKDAKRSKDDRALAVSKVKALAPRKTAKKALRLTVPAGTAPGAYRVVACADGKGKRKGKVKETKETNNCRAAALTVVPDS